MEERIYLLSPHINLLVHPAFCLPEAKSNAPCNNLTFSSVTLSAVGALIYKSSSGNEAVLVLDFGGTKTATNGDFVVQFPTANSSSAIIRLGDA